MFKNIPSCGTKWLPIMNYIHPLHTVTFKVYEIGKCNSASNAHKCSLNNGVSIAQKLVVKLSNTSTAFSKQVEITAIFQLYHGECMLIFNEMMMRSALY
jgi:hypothetical protein